jgi:hypothetical protein
MGCALVPQANRVSESAAAPVRAATVRKIFMIPPQGQRSGKLMQLSYNIISIMSRTLRLKMKPTRLRFFAKCGSVSQ